MGKGNYGLPEAASNADAATLASGLALPQGTIPREIAEVVLKLGRAEWGATKPRTAKQHAASTGKSVRITAEHFGQTEPQAMHGLYCQGMETIICHTGTSPNSPQTARALTGAWNHLHDLILAATETQAVGDGAGNGTASAPGAQSEVPGGHQ